MTDDKQPGTDIAEPSGGVESGLEFPVVGIGASAGGLLALRKFFELTPNNTGMAFVVILHLSPKHESTADAVLAQVTRMPVLQVRKPVKIEPDHVYVISPRNDLRMVDGVLSVEEARRPRGQPVAVDLFFRTLADTHGDKAVGVVLSGTGSDGALGIARVKEQGGVTFAQLPEDCEYEDMPRNALSTGKVDFVLPVTEMPQRLLQLWDNARRIRLPTAGGSTVMHKQPDVRLESEQALREILEILLFRSGHDFRHYKRATVLRRIERRLQVNLLPDLPAYRDFLKHNPTETRALLDDMLISVTNFFRDRDAFEAIERDVIGQLFDSSDEDHTPRVWVPACATGEEAYSLAMLLAEHASESQRSDAFQVFASDIDEPAIAVARNGVYPASILTDVPPGRLKRFFSREGEHYRIAKPIRERVLFAMHNVLRDPPFSRIDLISCRNLLIYLDRDIQARLLEMFYFALRPGGFLFLGSSESAESGASMFDVVDKKQRIYRARPAARGVRYTTLLPGRPAEPPPAGRTPAQTSPRVAAVADVHQRILEHYAPPSVIVDRDYTLVHMSERVGRFLQHAGGPPTHNLLSQVLPELRRDLRTALFQAVHSGKSVEARRVRLERDGKVSYVNMVARPFRDPEALSDFLLVLFDEVEDTLAEPAATGGGERDDVVHRLQEELDSLKDRLQNTIEQSEISSEELKASNEELQAINEELRSATEELETSKEELQSVNEELITVNSELKLKVEETAKANDDLQNFITSVDIASVFVDSQLRIKRFTPRAADIFNIIPSDIGRCLLDITHKLDYEKLADDARAAFENLRYVEREVRSTDGRCFAARALPYRTGENRIDGAVLSFFDTTSLRRAEERISESEDQLRVAAAANQDHAILVIDHEGRLTAWNAGAEALFGYAAGEILGQPLDLLFVPEDATAGRLQEDLRLASERGSVSEERWYRHSDGHRVYCSGSLTVLLTGHCRSFVKILRDATLRHRADQATSERLRSAIAQRNEIESASSLKDDFIAVISHELKNPLNLISVNTDILAREPALRNSPNSQQAVKSIRSAVRGQGKIIDDLLDMSRIRTGKFTLAPVPVDLNGVVESIVEIAGTDATAAGLHIEAVCLPRPAVVNADPSRLEQIVWNLVANAIKFTPEGGSIRVEVGQDGNFFKLSVIDTGRGIEAYFLPRIFDMFGQAPGRALRGRTGLGIGLNLVRQLVDRHGGRIRASSDGLGKGATFTVWLPAFDAAAPLATEELPPADIEPRLAGLRVLVVEDSIDAAGALRVLLQLEGADVTVAHDGVEGLRCLADDRFDLVLSDIGMPGMDGYEFVANLRNHENSRHVPTIALTGFAREPDVAQAIRAGFDAHVSKPVSLDELVGLILRVAGKTSRG
jgi:two-component system CheB/CheR fusion protein